MPTKKVGFLIKQVHILQEQKLNKKFDRFDLTGAQMFTIINLFKAREKGERLTQRDLERILDILNRLESKGLIVRVPCKHDARSKYIEVTDKASGLDKEIRKAFEESEEELLGSLSDEEITRLHEYLEKILRSNS